MKKIIFSLIICLGLISVLLPVYAQDNNCSTKEEIKAKQAETEAKKAEIKALKKTYKNITKEMNIIYALELMKNSPATGVYKKISGDNPTLNPIKIKYKNLGKIKPEYRNYNALTKASRRQITININDKHKNAPYEAQSALIAGMISHIDKKESVNEIVYSKTLEAFLWNYYLKKNPALKQDKSALVISENRNLNLYKKSPKNSKEIVSAVRKQRPDIKYIWESNGFTFKEYTDKLDKIYKAYLEVESMPDTVNVIPVLNLKEKQIQNQCTDEGFIKEHIRNDIKAKTKNKEDSAINTNTVECSIDTKSSGK